MERGRALAEGDVEDLVFSKVAERGGKADTARELMLVDAEKARIQPVLELRVLKQDLLVVEAFVRGHGYALQLCDILIGNTLVVFEEDVLFQQFRGAVPRPDARKASVETVSASLTAELVAAYPKRHGIHGHAIASDLAPEGVPDS